jgi:hypothetical protein
MAFEDNVSGFWGLHLLLTIVIRRVTNIIKDDRDPA